MRVVRYNIFKYFQKQKTNESPKSNHNGKTIDDTFHCSFSSGWL